MCVGDFRTRWRRRGLLVCSQQHQQSRQIQGEKLNGRFLLGEASWNPKHLITKVFNLVNLVVQIKEGLRMRRGIFWLAMSWFLLWLPMASEPMCQILLGTWEWVQLSLDHILNILVASLCGRAICILLHFLCHLCFQSRSTNGEGRLTSHWTSVGKCSPIENSGWYFCFQIHETFVFWGEILPMSTLDLFLFWFKFKKIDVYVEPSIMILVQLKDYGMLHEFDWYIFTWKKGHRLSLEVTETQYASLLLLDEQLKRTPWFSVLQMSRNVIHSGESVLQGRSTKMSPKSLDR